MTGIITTLLSPGGGSNPSQSMPLGINLAGISYASSEQPFLNIFKTGQGWECYNSGGSDTGESVALYNNFLDAGGYPTTVNPGGPYSFTQVGTLLLRTGGPTLGGLLYPAGKYVFLYDGTGTFTFSDDFSTSPISSTPGRIVIDVAIPTAAGTIIRITSTSAAPNNAKNFRLVYSPDSTAGIGGGTVVGVNGIGTNEALMNAGEIFNPTFISRISPFKTLRFMDWMATLSNFQKNWSDRHLPAWPFYADSPTNATINNNSPNPDFGGINDGVPAEVMFSLCNKIGADGWFNMPAIATDDYVTQFATLAHSTLAGGRKAYAEYANELWNQKLASASGTMLYTVEQQVSLLNLAINPQDVYGTVTGSISGTTFTVTSILSGGPTPIVFSGQFASRLFGNDGTHATVPATQVTGQLSGTAGGAGTYSLNISQTLASTTVTLTGNSDFSLNAEFSSIRCTQVGNLWKTAWGVDAGRVIALFGGWSGNNGYNVFWLSQTNSNYSGTVASHIDALAVAPYFGYPVPNTFTLDQLFTEILTGGTGAPGGYPGGMVKQALDFMTSNFSTAQANGVKMIGYESGQTLVDFSHSDTALQSLYAAGNRDPRMGTAYTIYYNGWKSAGGGVINHYNDIQQQTVFGFWGALENVLQTSSPKYNALVSLT